jgi:hypothetical protein
VVAANIIVDASNASAILFIATSHKLPHGCCAAFLISGDHAATYPQRQGDGYFRKAE